METLRRLLQQVAKQDFRADGDEDDTADGFGFVFKEMTEFLADEYAQVREGEGYKTNDYDGGGDGGRNKRKRDTDCQGVDTCGDGQNQQDKDVR